MTSITIESLTTAAQLNNVNPDVFDNPIIPESLNNFLNDPGHVMYIAQDGDLVVGMASAFVYYHPDKPAQMFINEVGVADAYQNQGIGRRLIKAMLNEASARGITYAWLGTAVNNKQAQACFNSVADGLKPTESFLLYEWERKA